MIHTATALYWMFIALLLGLLAGWMLWGERPAREDEEVLPT